jgi:hypothetical protein
MFMAHVGNPCVVNMWADAPYTTWTDVVGSTTGYHGAVGAIMRKSANNLVIFRPWMRYGSASGSQAEVWGSTDNGATWAITAQPWGVYPGGLSLDHRGGSFPHYGAGRWWWADFGDGQTPVIVSTADWTTFTNCPLSGNNFARWSIIPSNGALYSQGRQPTATSGGDGSKIIRMSYDAGFNVTDDGAFGEYPAGSGNGWSCAEMIDNRPWAFEL